MPSKAYELGLTSCCEPFKVVVTDYDGDDIVEELKGEISNILEQRDADGRPVPVYIMTGVLGAIRAEVFILLVHNGVPFILDPAVALEGGSIRDGALASGNTFISRMFAVNNNHVYSIGYVDDIGDAYEYAIQYTRTTPLVKNADISEETAALYISSNSDTVNPVGKIQRMGGSVFEVYAFSNTESSLIRTDKDFIGGEPYDQNGIHKGKFEVILYGGDPEIIPIGAVCGSNGDFFRVWVPNMAGFIDCGQYMIQYGDIPIDALYVDYGELSESYVMYATKLISDEQEGDSETEETDVPDFDYEEFYEDE